MHTVSSDHSCYDLTQKRERTDDVRYMPHGLPGVETRMPVAFTALAEALGGAVAFGSPGADDGGSRPPRQAPPGLGCSSASWSCSPRRPPDQWAARQGRHRPGPRRGPRGLRPCRVPDRGRPRAPHGNGLLAVRRPGASGLAAGRRRGGPRGARRARLPRSRPRGPVCAAPRLPGGGAAGRRPGSWWPSSQRSACAPAERGSDHGPASPARTDRHDRAVVQHVPRAHDVSDPRDREDVTVHSTRIP